MGGGRGGTGGRGGRGRGFNPTGGRVREGGGGGGGGGAPGIPLFRCRLGDLQRPAADGVRRGQQLPLKRETRGVAAVNSQGHIVGYLDQDCADRFNETGALRASVAAVESSVDGQVIRIEVEPVPGP